jgi:hypothetical protein
MGEELLMFKINEITGHLPECGFSVEGGFPTLQDAFMYAERKQRFMDSTLTVEAPNGSIWFKKTRSDNTWREY